MASASGVSGLPCEWLHDAVAILSRKRVGPTGVHDARKQLKKARAALRLLRDSLSESDYERENASLRDAARPLGLARDSKVLIATLDTLAEASLTAAQTRKLSALQRLLRAEHAQAKRHLTPRLIARQRKAVQEVMRASAQWPLRDEAWPALERGIRRAYRNGRQKMHCAKKSLDPDELHDWRKQVKYLWHQLQILQPLWPGLIGELADQCHKLANHLGDDHDLVVLREKIEANAATLEPKIRDVLLPVLDPKRLEVQTKAFALGEKIFDEKPTQFAEHMGKYWLVWHASASNLHTRSISATRAQEDI